VFPTRSDWSAWIRYVSHSLESSVLSSTRLPLGNPPACAPSG